MYARVGFLVFFMMSTSVYGQSQFGGLTPSLVDTVLNSDLESINYVDYKRSTGELYTGIVIDYHDNGQLKFKRSVAEGKAEGIWIGYKPKRYN